VELKKRGYEVVATARRPETIADIDADGHLALDVTDDASVAKAVAAAGTIDVLVNNAGIGIGGPIELVPMAEVRRVFETNTFGPLRMMQAVLPQMRARGAGTIVNVSSVSGRVSAPLSGFYAASKFALEAMSEALHIEGGHFGIRTIVIEPGFFKTNISESHHDFGVDAAPYDELDEIMGKLEAELGRAAAPGPEVVATAIADALESPGSAWRVPVGTDAEMVIGARATMDDAAFEKAMREVLKLDW
jgi:NAD(P)-dependent dehydrogenase (short-subunit alcohol dehydrogenase family)